jgi:hypothetical protein
VKFLSLRAECHLIGSNGHAIFTKCNENGRQLETSELDVESPQVSAFDAVVIADLMSMEYQNDATGMRLN